MSKNGKPRQWTRDEMRKKTLDHIRALAKFWAEESRAETAKEKVEGLAFSILVMLDGGSGFMPAFCVVPAPHHEDRQYQIDHGENYWPDAPSDAERADIGGSLHEEWHSSRKVRA